MLLKITKNETLLLTKITAAQNEVTLSHHGVSELYSMAVISAATILTNTPIHSWYVT